MPTLTELTLQLGAVVLQVWIVFVIVRELRRPLYRFATWRQGWANMLGMSLCMLTLLVWNLFLNLPLIVTLLLLGQAIFKLLGLLRLSRIFGAELTLSKPTDPAMVECDAFSMITAWNAQATRLLGWTEAEALGQTLLQTIVPPRDWEAHRNGIARLLDTGNEGRVIARTFAVNARRKRGDEIPVSIRIISVPQPDGSMRFRGDMRELGEL